MNAAKVSDEAAENRHVDPQRDPVPVLEAERLRAVVEDGKHGVRTRRLLQPSRRCLLPYWIDWAPDVCDVGTFEEGVHGDVEPLGRQSHIVIGEEHDRR